MRGEVDAVSPIVGRECTGSEGASTVELGMPVVGTILVTTVMIVTCRVRAPWSSISPALHCGDRAPDKEGNARAQARD